MDGLVKEIENGSEGKISIEGKERKSGKRINRRERKKILKERKYQ